MSLNTQIIDQKQDQYNQQLVQEEDDLNLVDDNYKSGDNDQYVQVYGYNDEDSQIIANRIHTLRPEDFNPSPIRKNKKSDNVFQNTQSLNFPGHNKVGSNKIQPIMKSLQDQQLYQVVESEFEDKLTNRGGKNDANPFRKSQTYMDQNSLNFNNFGHQQQLQQSQQNLNSQSQNQTQENHLNLKNQQTEQSLLTGQSNQKDQFKAYMTEQNFNQKNNDKNNSFKVNEDLQNMQNQQIIQQFQLEQKQIKQNLNQSYEKKDLVQENENLKFLIKNLEKISDFYKEQQQIQIQQRDTEIKNLNQQLRNEQSEKQKLQDSIKEKESKLEKADIEYSDLQKCNQEIKAELFNAQDQIMFLNSQIENQQQQISSIINSNKSQINQKNSHNNQTEQQFQDNSITLQDTYSLSQAKQEIYKFQQQYEQIQQKMEKNQQQDKYLDQQQKNCIQNLGIFLEDLVQSEQFYVIMDICSQEFKELIQNIDKKGNKEVQSVINEFENDQFVVFLKEFERILSMLIDVGYINNNNNSEDGQKNLDIQNKTQNMQKQEDISNNEGIDIYQNHKPKFKTNPYETQRLVSNNNNNQNYKNTGKLIEKYSHSQIKTERLQTQQSKLQKNQQDLEQYNQDIQHQLKVQQSKNLHLEGKKQ
ncbi:hypothetical protein PPERSA_04784 [Pseudocohnilembus persalinus]|uniref:Uncharacterized protein n=1 Tax=Pseudocohnilembus persalinus TaxID=266149 RepID=A0A0V0Q9F1_PSEPJ|nr:hypothetical protein PPERSA_04784 [Pseudocohnilembus persalinus]|eukprot:KRW98851.1 hypothetical protein PPERSA_04784 [Pseudocohnilembus persalinus]